MLRKIAGRLALRATLSNAYFCRNCSSSNLKIPAGQPTHFTHPHLLQEKEILPGMRRCEFRRRRSLLMEAISQQGGPSVALIPSAPDQFLSEKIPRPYRQSSDLLYLSGCQEAGSALLLRSLQSEQHQAVLFVRGTDTTKELWDGARFGVTLDTADYFGVDLVLPADKLEEYLQGVVKDNEKVTTNIWYDKSDGPSSKGSRSIMDSFVANYGSSIKLNSVRPLLHQLRVYKSPAEVNLMRKACQIGADAIADTIAHENTVYLKGAEFIEESTISARVEFECRRRGAQLLGYPPVMATGHRTNTIHYVANNNRGMPGDLALMDAGCEYFGYNSDITRTWPLNGCFSEPQRAVYEAVLDVQQRLIDLLGNNRPSLNQLFAEMCRLLGSNLKEIGILPASASGNELLVGAHSSCPHHVSHFLGLDIHDTPSVSHSIPVQPGMVITMEPGVYIRPERKDVPAEFLGIGVRIEDDILITDTGCEVLSANCPKSVALLEKLMRRSSE